MLHFIADRSCPVTIQDLEGVTHTLEVTAESLFEAVVLGLAAIRGNEWVQGIVGLVQVSVADVRVEHTKACSKEKQRPIVWTAAR